MKQLGYTIVEVFILLSIIATLAVGALGIYALVHFIGKVW